MLLDGLAAKTHLRTLDCDFNDWQFSDGQAAVAVVRWVHARRRVSAQAVQHRRPQALTDE